MKRYLALFWLSLVAVAGLVFLIGPPFNRWTLIAATVALWVVQITFWAMKVLFGVKS